MAKYRKKPVVIEATQWFKNGDHPLDYSKDILEYDLLGNLVDTITKERRKELNWEGDIVRYYRHPKFNGQDTCNHCGNKLHEHGWVDTLEGGHIVCPGDFIITGIAGENYPCKPEIFYKTYEEVTLDNSQ